MIKKILKNAILSAVFVAAACYSMTTTQATNKDDNQKSLNVARSTKMLKRDGTGPQGNGPTGRRLGNCTKDTSNNELGNKEGALKNSDQYLRTKIDACYELLQDIQRKIDVLSKQEPSK